MSSTGATAQSYNDTNIIGEVFSTGGASNTGQFIAAIGGLNGARRVASQAYDMSATYSLDTPSANVSSENGTLTAGTAKFYAKSQAVNVCQIWKEEIAVSNLRLSATQQLNTASLSIGGMGPELSEFDRAAANLTEQLQADWEFSALQGTYVARSAVGTSVAMGGLVDSTVGISTNSVNASSTALSKDQIDEIMYTIAENGGKFGNMAFVCQPGYVHQLSEIYGFEPQDRNIGGVAVKQILTDFGMVGVIWTNAAPDNTIVVADLAYIQPVVLPDLGQDVLLREYMDGSSAQKGYIEAFIGIDFTHESYHGKIYGLA